MTMDPHRYLQGKSKVRSCIFRQGTGDMGLADRHPSGSREEFKRLKPEQRASIHPEVPTPGGYPLGTGPRRDTPPRHKLCVRSVGWHWPPAGHGPRPLTHASLIQTLTAIKHLLCARYGRGAGGTETQNVTALAEFLVWPEKCARVNYAVT